MGREARSHSFGDERAGDFCAAPLARPRKRPRRFVQPVTLRAKRGGRTSANKTGRKAGLEFGRAGTARQARRGRARGPRRSTPSDAAAATAPIARFESHRRVGRRTARRTESLASRSFDVARGEAAGSRSNTARGKCRWASRRCEPGRRIRTEKRSTRSGCGRSMPVSGTDVKPSGRGPSRSFRLTRRWEATQKPYGGRTGRTAGPQAAVPRAFPPDPRNILGSRLSASPTHGESAGGSKSRPQRESRPSGTAETISAAREPTALPAPHRHPPSWRPRQRPSPCLACAEASVNE